MPWFVYVIKSEVDGRLFKGMSEEIPSRLIHNRGKVSSTKDYRPWKLVYTEEYKHLLNLGQEKILKVTRKGGIF